MIGGMALVTTTALCLRKLDFSETSQILTLLTADLGTVGAIAKGARRNKSSFGAPLDVMCAYQVVLYDRSKRGTLSILAQAELVDFFPGARRSYDRYRAIETLRELLLAIEISPEDAQGTLLLAVRAMRGLVSEQPPSRVMAEFAWGLLRVLGSEPVVTECLASGQRPSGRVPVNFSLREMGLLAPPHTDHRQDLVRVSVPALEALTALALSDASLQDRITVDGWAEAFRLLAWLVAMQGGRRLRTVPAPPVNEGM
jgi:DNA repair protein RecO (recombination protein O)